MFPTKFSVLHCFVIDFVVGCAGTYSPLDVNFGAFGNPQTMRGHLSSARASADPAGFGALLRGDPHMQEGHNFFQGDYSRHYNRE
jgi:hypothetical protein